MVLNTAVTETTPSSVLDSEPRLLHFRQDVRLWLQDSASMVHWWSPDVDVLQAAVDILLQQSDQLLAHQTPCVFRDDDFLPLLQRLNALLAAAQRGESEARAHAGQLWVLTRADRMPSEHVDILRRICLHYPELQIHLALFSHGLLAPEATQGVSIREIPPAASHDSSSQLPLPVARPRGKRHGLFAALVLLAVGLAVWLYARSGSTSSTTVNADVAPAAAAASESVQLPASEAASALAPASQAAATSPALAPASEAASDAVPQADSLPVVSAAAVDKPRASMSASRRWLLDLPPNSFVVVHSQVATLKEAEAFRAAHSVLVHARILLTTVQAGRPARYLVVTGPFRSPDRVRNYTQRLEWKANARSYSREQLLAQIPD